MSKAAVRAGTDQGNLSDWLNYTSVRCCGVPKFLACLRMISIQEVFRGHSFPAFRLDFQQLKMRVSGKAHQQSPGADCDLAFH